jgi:DNA replication initiation complex subunit (GINS family)
MYADLYKAWKSEKSSSLPQLLPADIYDRTIMYLNGVNDELSNIDTHTIQSRLLAREKQMTERLLDELRQTRIRKIISAAQNQIPIQTTSLTEEESRLLEKIRQSLSSLDQRLPVPPQKEEITDELRVVRFLENIPEIVGVDLRIYGPFKKEDVASLPAPNAHALEKQGAAKAIEVKGIFPEN